MSDAPIRSMFISDFRRVGGHRLLPLDAPIVLLYGPNGAGKTSVLSALELALTGEIRNMRRHDPRYTAHLPFHGQQFATLRVDVSEELAANAEPVTMTVGGSRIEGSPALDSDAAQFYAERCYLDQVSLGQLLELYQYRVAKEESALARFVNELLGLEQLDSLRTGLSDATDFRRLRKLSEPLADAEAEAQRANGELSRATKEFKSAQELLTRSREALAEALEDLGLAVPEASDEHFGLRVAELLRSRQPADDRQTLDADRSLTALRGRIDGLANRPSVQRLEKARATLRTATANCDQWREEHGTAIEAWRADAANLELDITGDEAEVLDSELRRIDRNITRQVELVNRATQLEQQITDNRTSRRAIEAQLSEAQERAGSLAEGLAALREHTTENVCPVCDRNFAEIASMHLTAHIDRKIADLTTEGVRLRELRQQRDSIAAGSQRDEEVLEQIRGELLPQAQRAAVTARRDTMLVLRDQLRSVHPAIVSGRELHRRREDAKSELEELEAIVRDADVARSELVKAARALGAPPLDGAQTLEDAWRRLAKSATERLAQRNARHQAHAAASVLLEEMLESNDRVVGLKDLLAESAQRKVAWESRVQEARRRQTVARAVLEASSKARATIVQRVFTESLNEVWRSVFTRLAPREPFVPAFGIPTSSKTALELTLETVHTSGASGGPPQMMLSAGNLNTAALSLFIALHLAVEPLVPCLVFDDPVQSMDEVHVAQFAGLIRVLSKHHKRQVIIAVHERELFNYLTLELSPAFKGDELITIDLGARLEDEYVEITRLTWSPDPAIAV